MASPTPFRQLHLRFEYWLFDLPAEVGGRALQLALLVIRHLVGDQALQRRSGNSAKAIRNEDREHHPAFRSESEQEQAERIQQHTQVNRVLLADLRCNEPDQSPLHHRDEHAHHAK